MKINKRKALDTAIYDGISAGLRRAYKHNETPSKDAITEEINLAIWYEIDELFSFKNIHEDD